MPITNTIVDILALVSILFIVFLILGAIGLGVYIIIRYKYRVHMRILTKSGSYVLTYWACKVRKDNEDKLKLLFNKQRLDMPKPEAINIGKSITGTVFHVELYSNEEDGSYTYIEDTGIKNEVPLKALSSDQRLTFLYQFEKALKTRGNTWNELIAKYGSLVLMIVFIVGFLALAPDVYDKHMQVLDKENQILTKADTILGDAQNLKYEIQEIKSMITDEKGESIFAIEPT